MNQRESNFSENIPIYWYQKTFQFIDEGIKWVIFGEMFILLAYGAILLQAIFNLNSLLLLLQFSFQWQ